MNIIETMKTITHYKLDDGRIWSIEDAQFATTTPEEAVIGPCPDEQGNSSLEGLTGCLKFYGFPLGELETEEDRNNTRREEILAELAEIDAKSTRAARATALAYFQQTTPNTEDLAKLSELESRAISLREELASLG